MELTTKLVDFNKYCPLCQNVNVPDTEEPCCECLETAARDGSHKPINFVEAKPEPKPKKGMPTSIIRKERYLYEASYSVLDYDYAKNYFKAGGDFPVRGACTAIRRGNEVIRNYDWTYSNEAQFIVHSDNKSARYMSFGFAGGLSKLTEEFVSDNNNDNDDIYRILPFCMQDGINEVGLFAEMNVVPKWNRNKNVSVPAVEERDSISALMLVRYVLDRFSSAEDACNYIRDYVSVYFPAALHDMRYELHYMIADLEHTYCLEFIDGAASVICIDDKPYITNFHLTGVEFNEDGTVYTPVTQDETHNAIDTNHVHRYGSGLERYNLIVTDLYSNKSSNDIIKALHYTNAYNPENKWCTEFVGIRPGFKVNSPYEEYVPILESAHDKYLNRSRDAADTWQTMHSCIYDLMKIKFMFHVQEG